MEERWVVTWLQTQIQRGFIYISSLVKALKPQWRNTDTCLIQLIEFSSQCSQCSLFSCYLMQRCLLHQLEGGGIDLAVFEIHRFIELLLLPLCNLKRGEQRDSENCMSTVHLKTQFCIYIFTYICMCVKSHLCLSHTIVYFGWVLKEHTTMNNHRLFIKMDDTFPLPPNIAVAVAIGGWSHSIEPMVSQSWLSIFIVSNILLKWIDVNFDFLVQSMSHPLTWRRQDLWPTLQSATRWRLRHFVFSSGKLSCCLYLYSLKGRSVSLYVQNVK